MAHNLGPPFVVLIAALLAVSAAKELAQLPSAVLPSVGEIAWSYVTHASTLANDALVTLTEVAVGLAGGVVLGVGTAVLVAASPQLDRAVMPWMAFLQNVPKIVLGPLFVIWLGFGLLPKVVLVVSLVYFPILVTTVAGMRATDPDLVELLRSLGAGKRVVFRRAKLPSALPAFFSGLKLAATVAPIGAIVGEWLGSDAGLGYRLLVAQRYSETDLLFATVILLALTGSVLYQLVVLLDRRTTRWHQARAGSSVVEARR